MRGNLRDFHRTEYHQNAPMCIVVAAVIVSVVMTAIGCVTVAVTQDPLFLGRNIFDCKILLLGLIVFHVFHVGDDLIASRLFRKILVFLLKFT